MYRGESKGGGGAPGEFFNSAESLITKKKRICPWNALKYELFPQVRVSVKKVCFRSYVKTNSSSSCPCQFFVAILFFFFFFNLPMPILQCNMGNCRYYKKSPTLTPLIYHW